MTTGRKKNHRSRVGELLRGLDGGMQCTVVVEV
jgi:hypothetical protein